MIFNNRDVLEIVNWTVFSYFLAVAVLMLLGNITFGYGLGDLGYFFVICFIAFAQLIISIVYSWRKNRINPTINWFFVGLFICTAVLITYGFTIGRGIENKWDGNIFVN